MSKLNPIKIVHDVYIQDDKIKTDKYQVTIYLKDPQTAILFGRYDVVFMNLFKEQLLELKEKLDEYCKLHHIVSTSVKSE